MLRGEIYSVDLGPGIGRELNGIHLVAVISNDFLNSLAWMISVVPGVDAGHSGHSRSGVLVTAAESGLSVDIRFLPLRVRSLDHQRFPIKALGRVTAARMVDIEKGLRNTLAL